MFNNERQTIAASIFCLVLVGCGTNTDEPIFPIFTAFSSVAAPAIISVSYTENTDETPYRNEFDVSYYVTNQEESFLGYNLYITSSSTSAESSVGAAVTGEPYLPLGIAPTFNHVDDAASTASADLQTQRVENYRAAPAPESFQTCELYFFRLTAVTRNGLQSPASIEVSACAAADSAACPSGTPCNPDET